MYPEAIVEVSMITNFGAGDDIWVNVATRVPEPPDNSSRVRVGFPKVVTTVVGLLALQMSGETTEIVIVFVIVKPSSRTVMVS